MSGHNQNHYADGRRDARKAIANGAPRWRQITEGPCIHADTGLPIARLSSPVSLADWRDSYVQGFNDEILAGIDAGNIHVDFRPLLMSRDEIETALKKDYLGTLSP